MSLRGRLKRLFGDVAELAQRLTCIRRDIGQDMRALRDDQARQDQDIADLLRVVELHHQAINGKSSPEPDTLLRGFRTPAHNRWPALGLFSERPPEAPRA